MRTLKTLTAGLILLGAAGLAGAETAWSTQDYDLYPGDFNGDGLTDLLYVARDTRHLNGIALSDGSGFNTPLQSWGNAYLGIPWSDGTYRILVADFNGDGKDDLFLQRATPGDHYVLLTEDGGIGPISQSVPNDAAGLDWSGKAHRLVAGDFDGDGRADLFLQANDAEGLNAVLTADAEGLFTAADPLQSWNDGYAGFDWAVTEAHVFAADFNGDGRDDLLLQAEPLPGTGPGTTTPAAFAPNMNGVVLAGKAGALFATEGVQAWSRDGFKAEWSPLASVITTADFNGDGRADVLLQGQSATDASFLLYGRSKGPIFEPASAVEAGSLPAAQDYALLAGSYGGKSASLYAQARSPEGSNFLASLTPSAGGTAVVTTLKDAALAFDAGAGGLESAAPGGGGPLALLLANTPGRTPGQFAVSPMGAATYQIPIWTPPGARGIEPHLAVVYTSGSPDGMMGPGWNLAGLSAIARCNKTYADNNGSPAAVALTTADDFCLDGNRMRVTSGTYGAPNSVYQTLVANFSRITAYGTAGNGPSYFYVEGKDGLIYEYGNTADSKAYANGGSTPYAWMLNKVRDRQGNNLKVVYSTTSGAVQPSSISYTQTPATGTLYPVTINFTYVDRVTDLSKYVAGGNIQETKVLGKIDVKLLGITSVRQYNFTYETASTTQRDRLSSIQECAGSSGTECLRATTVQYQDGAQGLATSPLTAIAATASVIAARDFNGDGRSDLLYTSAGALKVVFATSTGFAAPVTVASPAPSYVTYGRLVGTLKNDVLAVSGGVWTRYAWNSATQLFDATATTIAGPTRGGPLYPYPHAALLDINADGLADLLVFKVTNITSSGTTYTVTANFNNGGGGTFSLSTTATQVLSNFVACSGATGQICQPDVEFGVGANSASGMLDFNGDGMADILQSITYTSSSDVVTYDTTLLLSHGNSFSFGHHVTGTLTADAPFQYFGGLNNDACTDYGSQYVFFYADCSGVSGSRINGVEVGYIGLIDWNGDGLNDVLSLSGTTVRISLSTSIGWTTPVNTDISVGTLRVLDANGDGLADLATVGASSTTVRLHAGAYTPPDLASTVTDGWGVNAQIAYKPMTDSTVYSIGTSATFPEMDLIGAAYVVNRATQPDGIGGSFYDDFTYFGARIHLQGRGFEGFEKTQSWDSRNGLYHLVNYKQTFPYTGTVALDRVYRSDGTTLISQTDNQYKVITVNDLADTTGSKCLQTTPLLLDTRCFPYLDIATATSKELSPNTLIQTIETNYDMDEWGNPTTVTTRTTDNDPGSPFTGGVWETQVVNTIANYTAGTQWCLGKPTRTTTRNTVPNQPVLTRTVDHTVDSANCRFNTETIEPTLVLLTVATTFGYDICGNVNSVSIIGRDKNGAAMPARTTTSNFGTRCTFPETITNALSQSTTNTYSYTFGTKLSTTDPNGIAVSWAHDSFGRKTSETRPDGTSTTWTYEDCTTSTCWGISDNLRLRVTERLYDSASVLVRSGEKYFDAFERSRYAGGQRVLGTWTYTKTIFDNLGRKYEVHQPYSAATNGFHRYVYDELNRPTSDQLYNASNQLDRETKMAYAGLKTTIEDARHNFTTKWTDVTGKLRQIIDPAPGGTTEHTFDAFGNLVRMKDANLVQTDYTYNLRGFKTASSDPDTGSWTYTPNSLNELVEQRDAKIQLTTFGYDLLGRMTSRIEPESPTATTWTYGTSAAAHNIGRLVSLSKPDGYQESFTFDSLGRPAVSTYTMDSTAYAVDYTYNSLGAVDTLKYPTSSTGYRFTLKYVYSYGFVQQVKDNAAGTIFWSLSAANDYGSPTTEVLGNTATITSGYTSWTNDLTSRQVVKGTTLQNLAYQWDLNGNLFQRRDLIQSLTEEFANDALNRLTASTLNTVPNLTVGYTANGNIDTKSDAGAFNYTTQQPGCDYTGLTAQPHAVRKAGSTVFCYDKNGNMTSRGGSGITWYSYNQPLRINAGAYYSEFSYNANHQRWKQVATDASGTTTTRYIGGILEKLDRPGGVTEFRHMIPAGSGTAIYMRKPDGSSATTYLTTDHLGSGDLILDSSGSVLAKMSFAPFGARRGSNWQGTPSSADYTTFSNKTNRGFTGHEMLDALGLVNMNGRIYDPLIGRFLSADPVIQTINLSQALNPYSYVMNMPLTLVDPSGYSWLSKLWKHFTRSLNPFNGSAGAMLTLGMALPLATDPIAHSVVGAWYTNKATDRLLVAVPALQPIALIAAFYWGGPWGYAAASAHLAQLNGGSAADALVAGFTALAGSYLFSYVSSLQVSGWIKAPLNGVIAGSVSSANGGSFKDGFIIGAGSTAALGAYEWVAKKYNPTWRSGEEWVAKSKSSEPATPYGINIGVANAHPESLAWYWKILPWYEGCWAFEFLNRIPGFNSFSTVHDWFMRSIDNSVIAAVVNIPSMAPAMVINYAALLYGAPSIVISQYRALRT